ncbi:polyhydroxyalkanoate biosynthesis repressor PhaR [Leptospira congkakensis]|uniref:Polyhydroxyalkanoate biosynthesis repressor PhaR n=1 Tax=Leptospira congkakensis TaxID=2484932 RepID=A0A4Z1ACC6_9LEPT|nr:N-acetylneuraminate synthase family protein [Leptospira congkakensis]TGL90225.1 polyhydroxyalkanoate biosynthesis repressor PhaR [Leptospira congkakensis]TGL91231.1 polyhydroxyalkanoate biosynthesis repressor PhaR [Leptospira congkakensis]TGL98283.1 polyhydroxyalkanoate biosynthesis repressor PhaR [Leptospira congkakensis]
MAKFLIGNRWVGDDYPPLVIAEIGINHEGSLDVAIEMVDAAIGAGAEVIKHQTHIVEDEMSEEAKGKIPGNADVSIYEIMQRCSLNEEEEFTLMNYVKDRGKIFISTPFSREAFFRLKKFNIPAIKIGSGECNNYPLIKLVSSMKVPVILSTGMNSIETIAPSVDIFRRNNVPFALLHCTNVYPTAPEDIRLDAMVALKEKFPDAVIGLSDHSLTNYPCLGAVALGASILEKHFTDSKDRPGPDIVCSMDPTDLHNMIEGSNLIFRSKQGNLKTAVDSEAPTIAFAFASVVSIRDIAEGEMLTEENIWVKRPHGGDFEAKDFERLIGSKATRFIAKNRQLKKDDIKENE